MLPVDDARPVKYTLNPMRIFLDGPQHFDNLCAVVRTLEVFGITQCFVYDPNHLVRERYGKRRRREARTISAGAFGRVALIRVDDPVAWLAQAPGRIVSTVPADDAIPLPAFAFRESDTIIFGGESRGVSPEVDACTHVRLTIPQRGHTQSLNLSVSVGIVIYAAQTRMGDAVL